MWMQKSVRKLLIVLEQHTETRTLRLLQLFFFCAVFCGAKYVLNVECYAFKFFWHYMILIIIIFFGLVFSVSFHLISVWFTKTDWWIFMSIFKRLACVRLVFFIIIMFHIVFWFQYVWMSYNAFDHDFIGK